MLEKDVEFTENEKKMLKLLASYPELVYKLTKVNQSRLNSNPSQLSGKYLIYLLGIKICNRLGVKEKLKILGLGRLIHKILRPY